MPRNERVRASRMWEICKSGLKRAEAAGYPAPPLLDCDLAVLKLELARHCLL